MKKIAISGAGGFLGGYLIRTMQCQDVDIIALSSRPQKFEQTVHLCRVGRDAFDAVGWSDVDVLINCAFPRKTDPLTIAGGLRYTEQLLRAAVDGGVRAVIHISSQSVYDANRQHPAGETDPPAPSSGYALGKYASELLADALCRDIPHTDVRMASLIGPHFDQRAVNKMVLAALKGDDLQVIGGNRKMGFLDVRDAADALIRMAGSDPSAWKPVYNLGITGGYTAEEIAQVVARTLRDMGYAVPKIYRQPGEDSRQSTLDCTQFYSDFGWRPSCSLEDSVREIIRSNN